MTTSDNINAWYSPSQGHIFRRPASTYPGSVEPMVRVSDRYVVHELPLDAIALAPTADPERTTIGVDRLRYLEAVELRARVLSVSYDLMPDARRAVEEILNGRACPCDKA